MRILESEMIPLADSDAPLCPVAKFPQGRTAARKWAVWSSLVTRTFQIIQASVQAPVRLRRVSIRSKLHLAIALGTLVPFALGLWQTQRMVTVADDAVRKQLDDFADMRSHDVL